MMELLLARCRQGHDRAMVAVVYILTNRRHGTLYVGSTTDLPQRVWQHRSKAVPGFTQRHGVDRLVWFESHDGIETAALRERQLKKGHRAWKVRLIEESNPDWHDLYEGLLR